MHNDCGQFVKQFKTHLFIFERVSSLCSSNRGTTRKQNVFINTPNQYIPQKNSLENRHCSERSETQTVAANEVFTGVNGSLSILKEGCSVLGEKQPKHVILLRPIPGETPV